MAVFHRHQGRGGQSRLPLLGHPLGARPAVPRYSAIPSAASASVCTEPGLTGGKAASLVSMSRFLIDNRSLFVPHHLRPRVKGAGNGERRALPLGGQLHAIADRLSAPADNVSISMRPAREGLNEHLCPYCSLRAQAMHSAASGRALSRSGAISSPHRTHCP